MIVMMNTMKKNNCSHDILVKRILVIFGIAIGTIIVFLNQARLVRRSPSYINQHLIMGNRTISSIVTHEHVADSRPARAVLYVLCRQSGFGSQIINMLTHQLYFEMIQERVFFVDESNYAYRWNESIGLLTGYFTPTMPVLSHVDDRLKFATKHFPDEALLDQSRLYWAFNQGRKCPLDEDHLMGEEVQNQQPILYRSVFSHGIKIRNEIALVYGNKVYPLLIPYACSTMLFNARAWEEIHSYRKAHGIPINWKSIGIDNNNQKSVGIHIRRSDKVQSGESTSFEAALYVQKIINVTGGLEARKSISALWHQMSTML